MKRKIKMDSDGAAGLGFVIGVMLFGVLMVAVAYIGEMLK